MISSETLTQPLRTYLFGYHLRNSLSPLLHATLFESLNIPWTYTIVESTDKNDFLPKLKLRIALAPP
jgi:quinate dehydrogenase